MNDVIKDIVVEVDTAQKNRGKGYNLKKSREAFSHEQMETLTSAIFLVQEMRKQTRFCFENDMRSYLINTITKTRQSKNLTLSDLEERSGVAYQVLNRLENKESDPQLKTLLSVLTALELQLIVVPKIDDLFDV